MKAVIENEVDIQRPREAVLRSEESRVVVWFRRASTPAVAYGLLAFAALGYSLGVALPLALANALPQPEPYLRIPDAEWFRWAIFFYAPVIAVAWLVGSGVMYLVAWGLGRKADFSELLRLTAFATGLGTLATLLQDLVISPLRALGVINERAWEHTIATQGGWLLFLYVVLFVIGYPIAVRLATELPWVKAVVAGILGFVAFQAFEFIFIR